MVVVSQSLFQEIYYYTNDGAVIKNEVSTLEATSVKVQEVGNQQLAEALTVEGGPLQAGALPEAAVATNEGQKELHESISNAGVAAAAKPKPNKNRRGEGAEKATPKTILELGAYPIAVCDSNRQQ